MTYTSPTWVDVPPGTLPPPGAPALDAANLQPLTDAVAGLSAGAATEAALAPTVVKAANYTLVAGDLVPFDLTAASRIGTLPTTPPDKSQVLAYIKLFGTGHTLTLTAGGSDLIEQTNGTTGTTVVRSAGAGESVWLQYDHPNALWRQLPDRIPLSLLDARYNATYVPLTQVGQASGVASLDSSGLVPVAQLPISTTSLTLAGDGVPSSGLGVNGDTYLNRLTNFVYEKAGGAWAYAFSLPPSAVPSGFTTTRRFDPITSVSMPSASNVRKSRAQLGLALAATGFSNIVCIGDSTVQGYPSAPNVSSWPKTLKALLLARGYPSGGTGVVPTVSAYNNAAPDSRWSFTSFSQWVAVTTYSPLVTCVTNGGTATFSTIASGETGTVMEWWVSAASGTYSYSIYAADGTTVVSGPTSVAVGGGTGESYVKQTITGLANTAHKLVITTTSTAAVYVSGAQLRGTSGLIVHNLGYAGSNTVDWDTTQSTHGYHLPGAAKDHIPAADLVLLSLLDNDFNGARGTALTQAVYQQNLTNIIGQWRTLGADVMLVIPPAADNSHIVTSTLTLCQQSMYTVADATNCPLLDIPDILGPYTTANTNGLTNADGQHCSPAGYALMGASVAHLIP